MKKKACYVLISQISDIKKKISRRNPVPSGSTTDFFSVTIVVSGIHFCLPSMFKLQLLYVTTDYIAPTLLAVSETKTQ